MSTSETRTYALEQWHRAWEINNPDKIITPSFASEADMTHDHVWERVRAFEGLYRPMRRCVRCPVAEFVD